MASTKLSSRGRFKLLMTGLMQDFLGVEDVVLQPNRRSLLIQFNFPAMLRGLGPCQVT
jgi:hypothetical protein